MSNNRLKAKFWAIWSRRYVGHTIAVPLVLLLLFVMTLIEFRARITPEPEPMRITMEIPPDVPEPEPPPPEEEPAEEPPELDPVPFEPAVATRVDSPEDETELVLDPEEGEPDASDMLAEQEMPPPPVDVRDWVPTTDQMAELRTLDREVNRQAEALDAAAKEIREMIVRREVSSAARDFELDTDGGLHGAIRMLKLDGFPQEIVEQVLGKYRITFERRHASPSAGRSFLNAAQTEGGTFRNVDREGIYDVLVLSSYAMTFMATKEIEAVQARGYDPATTRVRKIVFGIVMNNENEYDLGVVDLEMERVR